MTFNQKRILLLAELIPDKLYGFLHFLNQPNSVPNQFSKSLYLQVGSLQRLAPHEGILDHPAPKFRKVFRYFLC